MIAPFFISELTLKAWPPLVSSTVGLLPAPLEEIDEFLDV